MPGEQQDSARERFRKANESLEAGDFRGAADDYRSALALWNHPGIHYNLALTLVNLNDPVEVRAHLLEALKYGEAPLDHDRYERASTLLTLVEQQLAKVEISCNLQGATVTMNQKFLFHGPGRYEGYVRPDVYTIEATRSGYERRTLNETLLAGRVNKIEVRLYTGEELMEKHTRWPFWIPVTITAGGAALLGAGGLMLAHSNSKLEDFDKQLAAQCPNGCIPSSNLEATRDSGNHYKTAATISFVAGGAAFVTGAAMMVLDIPSAKSLTPDEYEKRLQVQPSLGSGFLGLAGMARF